MARFFLLLFLFGTCSLNIDRRKECNDNIRAFGNLLQGDSFTAENCHKMNELYKHTVELDCEQYINSEVFEETEEALKMDYKEKCGTSSVVLYTALIITTAVFSSTFSCLFHF